MTCLVFVGTVTHPVPHFEARNGAGIHVLRLDEETGTLTALSVTGEAVNPHYLAFDPTVAALYAIGEVMEWPEGRVTAYRFDPASATLRMGNWQPTRGHLACFLSLSTDRRHLFVANYGMKPPGSEPDRAFAAFPVTQGSIGSVTGTVSQQGHGPNPERQERSHPHCILQLPDGRLACTDLGTDELRLYAFDPATGQIAQQPDCIIRMPPGAGPRHLVHTASGDRLFVVNEMAATVTLLRRAGSAYAIAETVSILPAETEAPDRYAAAIVLSPQGHLYVSNRRPDCISLLTAQEGNGPLRLAGCWPSGGRTPRSMALSPTGRFLLVGNQDSGDLSVFAVAPDSGALTQVSTLPLAAPMCIIMAAEPATFRPI